MRFPLFVLHSPDIKLLWGKLRNVSLNETSDPLWFMETDGLNMFHLFDLFSLFSSRACAFNTTFCLNNGVSSQSSQNFKGFLGGTKELNWSPVFLDKSNGDEWWLWVVVSVAGEAKCVLQCMCNYRQKGLSERESAGAHTTTHARCYNSPHLTSLPRPFSSGFWPPGRPRSACRRWARIAGRSRYRPASLAVGRHYIGENSFNR